MEEHGRTDSLQKGLKNCFSMIADCAIDPKVMGKWKGSLEKLDDRLGVEHGRLVSQMPKKWIKEVFEIAKELAKNGEQSEMDLKRVEAFLYDSFFRRSVLKKARRNFASDKSWIESVTECEPAFDLIIASIDSHEENVVSIENLEPKKPPFFQDRSVTIPCLSDEMINSMRLLIEESHEFVIVDPYCRPEFNSSKVSLPTGYRSTLISLFKYFSKTKTNPQRIDIHTSASLQDTGFDKFDAERDREIWERDFLSKTKNYNLEIPVKINYWNPSPEADKKNEKLHARYFLTDKGGVNLDLGFQEIPDRENRLSLLSNNEWEKLYFGTFDVNAKSHENSFKKLILQ